MEDRAPHYWDVFYKQNKNKFFKDRHWFEQEFPLLKGVGTVLEVGCGTGSSIYPLLSLNESVHVYACDFAESAVKLVLEHQEYTSGRVDAFVADITSDALTKHVPEESIDACLMIFVLSAISPSRMLAALVNINSVLRVGGIVCFRDYSFGDLAQKRLDTRGRARKIEENFFARGDGTRAYFFTEEMLTMMFKQANFEPMSVDVINKFETNRKLGVSRDRKYVQAVFRKMGSVDTKRSIFQSPVIEDPKPKERVNQEEYSLGAKTRIGVIAVRLGQCACSIEDSLVQFILEHPRMFMGSITIDVATQTRSGGITFAALNYSNRHITVTSSQTRQYMKYVFTSNQASFVCERLRLVQDEAWDPRLLQVPYATQKFIFLAIPEFNPRVAQDLLVSATIVQLDPSNTRIFVACAKDACPSILETAHQFSLQPAEPNVSGCQDMKRDYSLRNECILVLKM